MGAVFGLLFVVFLGFYSVRRATVGSTWAARQAAFLVGATVFGDLVTVAIAVSRAVRFFLVLALRRLVLVSFGRRASANTVTGAV